MGGEKPTFGINIDFVGKNNPDFEVTVKGRRLKLDESAAPRSKDLGRPEFPAGTVESLMPLLRDIYSQNGEAAPESYWLDLEEKSTMSPQDACAKLRSAGKGSMEVAEAMLSRDQRLQVSRGFGRMTDNDYQSLLSSVASVIKEYYHPKPHSLR